MSVALKNIPFGTELMTAEEVSDKLDLKQDTITGSQLAALTSGSTERKINSYDTHIADSNIHVTVSQKSQWNSAQPNVIEKVKLNGTELPVNNKAVNISIPNLDNFVTQTELEQKVDKSTYATDKASFATKSELANKQDALTSSQISAVNSGIDSTKVYSYSSHITNGNIHVTTDDKAKWNSAQANVIEKIKVNGVEVEIIDKVANLSVLTSYNGITKDELSNGLALKVDKTTYNADKANIESNKQDKLSTQQMAAVNSNVNSAFVTSLTEHRNNSNIHVTTTDTTKWNTHVSNSEIHVTAEQKQAWTAGAMSSSDRQKLVSAIQKIMVNGTEIESSNNTVNIVTDSVDICTKAQLNTALSNYVSNTTYNAKMSSIDSSIANLSTSKQNTLSTTQLNATNSGITAAKVAAIDSSITSYGTRLTTLESQIGDLPAILAEVLGE